MAVFAGLSGPVSARIGAHRTVAVGLALNAVGLPLAPVPADGPAAGPPADAAARPAGEATAGPELAGRRS